jgi:hypothetical protein
MNKQEKNSFDSIYLRKVYDVIKSCKWKTANFLIVPSASKDAQLGLHPHKRTIKFKAH